MNAVFLDTVGLLALWDRADQWHSTAEASYARIVADRRPFFTTTFVLLELGNAAARRSYRAEVSHLRRMMEQRNEVIIPTEEDWEQAWIAFEQGDAAQAGIVDHITFQVMRRTGLRDAFTNDQHFHAAGFVTLF